MSTTAAGVVAAPVVEGGVVARVWRYLKRLYLFLLPVRFSFLALGIVAFAFLVSAQGFDIIANIAEDDPTGAMRPHTWQRVGYIAAIVFLSIQIWYWSRQLLRIRHDAHLPSSADFPRLTKWLPRILGALSYVITIGALYRVADNYGRDTQPANTLMFMALVLLLLGVLFIVFCSVRRKWIAEPVTDQVDHLPKSTRTLLAISTIVAFAFFLWATFLVQTAAEFGCAAIVILSFALWVPFGSILVHWGHDAGVPVFTFLLVWAFVISPLADNHVVKTVTPPATGGIVAQRQNVGKTFDLWYARLQREHPNQKDHPVFIVATEGGGIRAAYWTAAVLTTLTDDIPEFHDHLFAISGVSGGSLGAAVYDALLANRLTSGYTLHPEEADYTVKADEATKLRTAAKVILGQDSLAPTLAAMTQPDFVQRFVPAPIFPDRARALEGAWEKNWSRVVWEDGKHDETFSEGFLQMLHDKRDRLPSLFLNGTTVETGQRIIASNCSIEDHEIADSVDLFRAIGADLRVSTAVANSTRFTYVSPAGTLRRAPQSTLPSGSTVDCKTGARCEHVVDGGYFENSGAETAGEILDVIKKRPGVKPYVIYIQFHDNEAPPTTTAKVGSEVLSPLRALLSVRGSRGDLAVAELKRVAPAITFRLVQTSRKTAFPLGWLLADRTRNLMDAQMGPKDPENGPKMAQIASILAVKTIADPVQEKAIAAEKAE